MNTNSMIRFVIGPEGNAIPDVFCKLQGKGMWVGASKNNIEKAFINGSSVDLSNHQKDLFNKYNNK
mgnify:CR=1 FL=1